MKSLTFHDKKERFGLQVADLFSHTAYLAEQQNEEEMALLDLPPGGALADAENIVRHKGPLYRGVLGPEQLQEIKKSKIAYDRNRIEFGQRRQREIASRTTDAALVEQSSET